MSRLPTKQELLKIAKQMIVNLEVAKTMDKKSQTRRVIPFKIYTDANNAITAYSDTKNMRSVKATIDNILQRSVWKKGDILWVREPVKIIEHLPVGNYGTRWHDCDSAMYQYLSDGGIGILLEIPERFKKIPKWIESCKGVPNGCIKEMARTFLVVTNVKVERLKDITLADLTKEGVTDGNITERYKK